MSLLPWLFAPVMAYPCIPGSDTGAFTGIGARRKGASASSAPLAPVADAWLRSVGETPE